MLTNMSYDVLTFMRTQGATQPVEVFAFTQCISGNHVRFLEPEASIPPLHKMRPPPPPRTKKKITDIHATISLSLTHIFAWCWVGF